jgi:phospholipase C
MANLEKVDHIVVLMLENRSFDHMLGYLSLEGGRGDIDGLRGEFANEYDGRSYPVHHLGSTAIADDPDHSANSVDLQTGGGAMNGFVTNFADTLARRGVREGDPGRVMGYYNAADVPVYDHLAREFAVCDRWFSSVPGATWPNRLYAICGRAAGSRDDLPHNLPPLYDQASFVRHLDAHGISWRWYSFEAAGTLRFADAHYALGHHDKFAFFSRTKMNWKSRLERVDPDAASFLEDAARGTLPSVTWIDPNFSNFNPVGFQPNDDHAPADIKDGQELVLAVYHALATSPQWEKTSSITSRRPARQTTTRRCSATTGRGYRRWSSRRGSSQAQYHIPSWITRRLSRRSCCGSAPKRSTPPSGIMGCSRGSRAPGARIPWERGWRTPMI